MSENQANMTTNIAKLVHFEGYVQGVGFRYTARSLAQRFNITGYVMNMPDGTVDVHAEGPSDEVDAFIQALKVEMGEYIQDTKVEDCTPTGKYRRFDVRFH